MDGRHIGIIFPVSMRGHRHVILQLPAKFCRNHTIAPTGSV